METEDYNADGIIDEIKNYTYDGNNNLITQSSDRNGDGITDLEYIYSYGETNPKVEVTEESQLLLTDVHRFYQNEKGFHFYSADMNEVGYIKNQSDAGEISYLYEAEKYQVLASDRDTVTGDTLEGVEPIYRFFNTDTGAHLYTTDENEKDYIQGNLANYSFEGIKYYAFEAEPENLETIPVYRMLNTQSGAHLFSADGNEINYLQQTQPHFTMENEGNAAFHVFEL